MGFERDFEKIVADFMFGKVAGFRELNNNIKLNKFCPVYLLLLKEY